MTLNIIPTSDEEKAILAEIHDHAAYWYSDRCKLTTVEKHLSGPTESHPQRTGIPNVQAKIQWLAATHRVEILPRRNGDYIKVIQAH